MKDKLKIIFEAKVPDGIPLLEKNSSILEKWEKEIISRTPSYNPKPGDILKIFGPVKHSFPHSNEYVKYVENNGFFLPNVQGLIIVEYMDRILNFIKSGTFVMGIDYKNHLHLQKHSGHIIPVLLKNEEKSYSYLMLPWGMTLEADEVFPAFEWTKG